MGTLLISAIFVAVVIGIIYAVLFTSDVVIRFVSEMFDD